MAVYAQDVIDGICTLFLEVPKSVDEPIDNNQYIRDTHYYAGGYLQLWLQDQREDPRIEFRAMPWYRQKEVCRRAVVQVRDKHAGRVGGRTSFTEEDVQKIWHFLRKIVTQEASEENTKFQEKLALRGDFAEEL